MRDSKIQSIYLLCFFVVLSFLLFACNKKNNTNTEPEIVEFTVYPEKLQITQLGAEFTLNPTALDAGNNIITHQIDNIVWRSSDETLATVDQKGSVTIHGKGTVSISASFDGFENSSIIEIDESSENVNGLVRYQDRTFNGSGFTIATNPYKRVRYATVDLLDEFGNVFQSTQTDASGRFSFGYAIPDLYSIRVLAEVNGAPAPGFRVKDNDGDIWSVRMNSESATTSYQIDINSITTFAAAFNLLDVITASAEFAKSALAVDLANLTVYWQPGNRNGTYYCTGKDEFECEMGEGIYVLGLRSGVPSLDDTDEYDDDVIMHEFGHFLMANYAADDSDGGCHRLTQNDSDLRLSWSEGWGTFLPSAIKSWMSNNKPELLSAELITTYIDTVGNSAEISFDIANPYLPEATQNSFFYASSEAAVAKILWSVHDNFFGGMQKIWDSIDNYMPVSPRPTNVASFWDGLFASSLYNTGDLLELQAIFNERKIFYQDDTAEDDNSIATAPMYVDNVTNQQTRHLYLNNQELDVDYVAFETVIGNTYEVRTFGLTNGIDTALKIFDVSGNLIQENDDALPDIFYRFDSDCGFKRFYNDDMSLSSRIDFSPGQSGTYYVQVSYADKFSPQMDFTGHYGSYKLSITRQ